MLRAVCLALLLALAGSPAARAEVPPGIAMLDPGVLSVRIAGSWSGEAGKGPVRLVITRGAGAGMRLFVQWVGGGAVVSTVEVGEVAAGQYSITSLNVDAGENETAVHLGLRAPDGSEPGGGSVTLLIRTPGVAEFQSAGN
ncbi:MAG: hypothetical protein ACK50Q_10665 [Labrys sp. (in: a-proteobacteria)]|jgi:hypothetical protein